MSNKKEERWSFTDDIFDSLVEAFNNGDVDDLKNAIAKNKEALNKFNNGETVTIKNGEDIAGKTPEEAKAFSEYSKKKKDDILRLWSQWYIDSKKGDPEDLPEALRIGKAYDWYRRIYPKLLNEGKYVLSTGELTPEEEKKREESRKVQEDAMAKHDPGEGIPLRNRILGATVKNMEENPELYKNSKIGD